MSVVTSDVAGTRWAWLRNPAFDLSFIFGIPALAMVTGLVVILQPSLFVPILIFDLWFLGYHHVIATYTRLCFDRKSFAEHWPLMVVFLPAVAIGTLAVAYFVGSVGHRLDLFLLAVVPLRAPELGHFALLSRQGAQRPLRGRLARPGDLLCAAGARHPLPLAPGPGTVHRA